MATKEEHAAKADNNAAFAKSLDLKTQVNIDWALTSLFYAGLHYVDAYLTKNNTPKFLFDTHGKREKMVETDSVLKQVKNEYYDLKFFGKKARYECSTIKADKVTKDAIPAFDTVKNHIKAKL